MAHQFTSGVFLNSQPAWHRLGTVLDGTLPAREAFRVADALWQVSARPVLDTNGRQIEGYQAITRCDTGEALSIMSDTYHPVQNERLVQIAEALRSDLEMDAVCVLAGGKKVTFTARIRNASADVGRGDIVEPYLVGATSHDGTVAFQVLFTPVRVVCANTLAQALGRANGNNRRSIKHTRNAAQLIARLPEIIDLQRRQFTAGIEELQAMAATPCSSEQFAAYCAEVFADQLTGTINDKRGDASTARPKVLSDLPQWEQLRDKFNGGLIGGDLPGVRGTVWGAYNAITEFASHDAGRAKDADVAARQRLEALWFGKTAETLNRAHSLALAATRA
ncbi:MAG: DUF932 domain-containing protein [Candidatus Limnocylindrus sp.]